MERPFSQKKKKNKKEKLHQTPKGSQTHTCKIPVPKSESDVCNKDIVINSRWLVDR